MPRCIYCLEHKAAEAFNKEHVLPRAFGHFQNALTLALPRQYRVCSACNQRLGDSVDIGLARDSREAVLRLEHESTPPIDPATITYDRISLSLPRDHPWAPMLLQFVPSPDGHIIGSAPMAQLRITIARGQPTCIPEAHIARDLPALLEQGEPTRTEIFWRAADPDAPTRIEEKARAAGLTKHTWTPIAEDSRPDLEEVIGQLQITIDAALARAIAKIAYEYFVWCVGESASHLMKDDLLTPVRDFIVAGADGGDWRRLVMPTNDPILADETSIKRQTSGHILALNWENRGLVGRVALFNDIIYAVHICDLPFRIWHDIDSAHHFNTITKETTHLACGRFILRPPMPYR